LPEERSVMSASPSECAGSVEITCPSERRHFNPGEYV